MAATAAAALLDELMGRDRNVAPGERKRETRWDDSEVCKYFLCSFCPNDLFTNTRADLGTCEKIHDEGLKKSYQKSSRFERMGYEDDFVRHLQTLLADVERRIKRGHARLALNNTQGMLNQHPVGNANQEQVELLTRRINELVEEAEQLGCEGKVEEAQGVMKLCEQLRDEREQLTANRRGVMDEENIKRMEVCQVCGALLVSGDAQQRIDEHISGKQHVGYARIREYIETYKAGKKQSPAPEEKEAQILAEREEREKLREKEREERKKQEEEREKERERERAERHRRRRSRSRSRGRKSRSHSKDRSKRSHSRDRRRSRDKDHHSRSHRSHSHSDSRRSSRERSHRSRSRDRRSKKHREERDERGSAERNGEGGVDKRDDERPRNPPEPREPPSDDLEHTAGDTN